MRLSLYRAWHNRIKNNARVLQFLHPAGILLDDPGNTLQDAISAAAIRDHLRIPPQAAVLATFIKSIKDFLVGFHVNKFTRLYVERPCWCWVAHRNRTNTPREVSVSPEAAQICRRAIGGGRRDQYPPGSGCNRSNRPV